MNMPNIYMPAKDPEEVRKFFAPLVEQEKMKVTLATERPDVYTRLEPTEDVRLVVDTADKSPPEGAEFDLVLGEFRPEPIPEDQLASWTTTADQPSPAEAEQTDVQSIEEPSGPEPEPVDSPPAEPEPSVSTGVLDRPWTSFPSRGFKG